MDLIFEQYGEACHLRQDRDTYLIKYLQVFYVITFIIVFLVTFFSNGTYDWGVIFWQLFSIVFWSISLKIGLMLKKNQMLLWVFLFQLILSFSLHFFFLHYTNDLLGYNAVDSVLYSDLANKTKNLDFEGALVEIGNTFSDLSDYGWPVFLKYIYWIGGDTLTSMRILILVNCIIQWFTTLLVYNLSVNIVNDTYKAHLISLLWGLNLCSTYLNVSGLKETLFTLLCTLSLFYIYKCKRKPYNHILFWVSIASTYFFRPYMTFFFVIIYLGYCIFPYIYNRLFAWMCVAAIVLCLFFTSLLVYQFPEIYYAILNTSENAPSGLGMYIYWLLAFLGPLPKFFNMETPQVLIMITYTILKFSLSIFGLLSCICFIKNKQTKYYPLISIYLFTVLLLIVSGHYVNYRYSYIIMPAFFILMVEGIQFRKKWIVEVYCICTSMIMLIFNLKLY